MRIIRDLGHIVERLHWQRPKADAIFRPGKLAEEGIPIVGIRRSAPQPIVESARTPPPLPYVLLPLPEAARLLSGSNATIIARPVLLILLVANCREQHTHPSRGGRQHGGGGRRRRRQDHVRRLQHLPGTDQGAWVPPDAHLVEIGGDGPWIRGQDREGRRAGPQRECAIEACLGVEQAGEHLARLAARDVDQAYTLELAEGMRQRGSRAAVDGRGL